MAILADQADNEGLEQLLGQEDHLEAKNALLKPIYRELKAQIRHMTNTEERKLL